MESVDPIYQPTQFWANALKEIVDDIDEHGVETFKSHRSALKYYVQRYTLDPILFEKENVEKMFEMLNRHFSNLQFGHAYKEYCKGTLRMEMEHRIFLAGDSPKKNPDLQGISEDMYGSPLEPYIVRDEFYSLSMLSYLKKLAFLKKNARTRRICNVLEIGGGFGTLGEILLKSSPDYFFLNVDIPPVLYVATHYLKKLFGEERVLGYRETRDMDVIDVEELISKKYRAVLLAPWQLPKVKGDFQLFVNASSFQEMEPDVMRNYAKQVDRLVTDYVLLKNSRIGKRAATSASEVGVKETIVVDDYIKAFPNFDLKAVDDSVFAYIYQNFRADLLLFERKK